MIRTDNMSTTAAVPSGAEGPPGPTGSLLLGNLAEFARDNLRFFQRQIGEHGDVVAGRFFNRRIVILGHPDHVEQVLLTQHKNFVKHSFFWRHVTALFGRGLLTSEGELLRSSGSRSRSTAAHRRYADVMVASPSACRRLADGETRDAHQR